MAAIAAFAGSSPAWAAGAEACPPVASLTPQTLQAAMGEARDHGPLWRLSRDGRISYLYGTLHVGRAQWLAPGPQLRAALRDTDTVALELDPLDEALQAEMAAAFASRPPLALPPELLARLSRLWDAECLPAEARDKLPAEMQVITLAMMGGRRQGLDVSYGSEIVLSLFGHNAGRKVVSLETAALQLAALLATDEAQALTVVREGLDDLDDPRSLQVLLKTAQVWDAADLAELERYALWCECVKTPTEQAMMKRLLDDRNPGLARRIDELHAAGGKVFAAVGTLHMVGPLGLPALLAARGYSVTRLR